MVEDVRRLPPPIPWARAAGSFSAMVDAEEARGTFAAWLFPRVLRWGVRRASAKAAREAGARSWLVKASGERQNFRSPLRSVAWTGVLDDDRGTLDPASRAAALVVAALRFRAELLSPSCPPRLFEYCERFFGTTLLPGPDRFESHRGKGTHVIVGAFGTLRAVEVLGADLAPRDESEIAADLRVCLGAPADAAPPVLALTACSRGEAAETWSRIAEGSPEAVRQLEEALFSVFFDPSSPGDADACGRLAQGGPPENRCFWHALQIVVFQNAKAAVIGSFVGGVEGESSQELCARLGKARATPKKKGASRKEPRTKDAPPPLAWSVEGSGLASLGPVLRYTPVDAGGLVRAKGFGKADWESLGASPEAAVLLAMRLALDAVAPDLDEMTIMVNAGHVQEAFATSLGTTTQEMRELVSTARRRDARLGAQAAAALRAHRRRVGEAKRFESGESAMLFLFFALGMAGSLVRWLVDVAARLVCRSLERGTEESRRKELMFPLVAIDSSIPAPQGVAVVGRFGVPAPPKAYWSHHSIGDHETRFVLQAGLDRVKSAAAWREALIPSLARVRAALEEARAASHAGEDVPSPPVNDPPPPARLAFRRMLWLRAALRGEGPAA